MGKIIIQQDTSADDHRLIIKDHGVSSLSESYVIQNSASAIYDDAYAYRNVLPKTLLVDEGIFTDQSGAIAFPAVSIFQDPRQTLISCECSSDANLFCEHQSRVLLAVLKNNDLLVFFDKQLRHEKLKRVAADYGLENEADLESFFNLNYLQKKLVITPKFPGLLPANKESLKTLKELLIQTPDLNLTMSDEGEPLTGVIFRQHKYYKNLLADLFQAKTSKEGKIKNPLNLLSPREEIWKSEDKEELKFYTGITAFQNVLDTQRREQDIAALRAVIRNPLNLSFYIHDPAVT